MKCFAKFRRRPSDTLDVCSSFAMVLGRLKEAIYRLFSGRVVQGNQDAVGPSQRNAEQGDREVSCVSIEHVWRDEPDSGHQGHAPGRLTIVDTTTGEHKMGMHFEIDISLGVEDDGPRHCHK